MSKAVESPVCPWSRRYLKRALVSSARPKNGGRLEFIDGVWVTDLTLAVGLATVLRSHLIQLQQHKVVTPAGDNKFAAIQRYLSSTEFRQRIEAMVEAFERVPSTMSGIFLDHVHGAATRVDATATAFPHRTEGYNLVILS